MVLVVFITVFVLYMILALVRIWGRGAGYGSSPVLPPLDRASHNTALEVAWTVIPAALLVVVAVPSFALLYSLESAVVPGITTKVVGHQWYWSYEYRTEGYRNFIEAYYNFTNTLFHLKHFRPENFRKFMTI